MTVIINDLRLSWKVYFAVYEIFDKTDKDIYKRKSETLSFYGSYSKISRTINFEAIINWCAAFDLSFFMGRRHSRSYKKNIFWEFYLSPFLGIYWDIFRKKIVKWRKNNDESGPHIRMF